MGCRRAALIAVSGALAATPVVLGAQLPELAPGLRVRITTEFGVLAGTFTAATPDSLHVTERDGAIRGIPKYRVEQIDESLGRTGRAGSRKGSKIGAIVGAAGAGVYVVWNEISRGFYDPASDPTGGPPPLDRTIANGVVFAILGGLVGSFIGSRRGAEEWRQVYPAPAPQF